MANRATSWPCFLVWRTDTEVLNNASMTACLKLALLLQGCAVRQDACEETSLRRVVQAGRCARCGAACSDPVFWLALTVRCWPCWRHHRGPPWAWTRCTESPVGTASAGAAARSLSARLVGRGGRGTAAKSAALGTALSGKAKGGIRLPGAFPKPAQRRLGRHAGGDSAERCWRLRSIGSHT